MNKALIVWGGWDGHEPGQMAQIAAAFLRENQFEVEVSQSLDRFKSLDASSDLSLIVPIWTMGSIQQDQLKGLLSAVHDGGVGIAGMHGGMGDAFRDATEYQFMVGGQWVAHPGGIIDYRVHIVDHADEITAGLDHFNMRSEQYYMHVDPSNHVLATTTFEHNGCTMPVAWKRTYGRGRVYYCSLGNVAADMKVPQALALVTRGMLWAARR